MSIQEGDTVRFPYTGKVTASTFQRQGDIDIVNYLLLCYANRQLNLVLDLSITHERLLQQFDCGWSLFSHGAAETKWVDLGILNFIYEKE